MTLLEMHLGKKKKHEKFNEQVLRDHYTEVWKILEEEIRKVLHFLLFMSMKTETIIWLKFNFLPVTKCVRPCISGWVSSSIYSLMLLYGRFLARKQLLQKILDLSKSAKIVNFIFFHYVFFPSHCKREYSASEKLNKLSYIRPLVDRFVR